ncbi:Protein-N(5)-glutamine methyltransferase PrmC, methylates polypeptide chain release factors RF1 and RF2 [hydrothermal vent metagenome]|uniref:peptide chain release factor N(5)-glutamine methyltransferase n=1 Tax=hydrothermal vent metagenome TaxID=652676 RepID=A0A3B0VJC3_9ZZZZ
MNKDQTWAKLLVSLRQELKTLPDKPEENPETTLKALWFKAAGDAKSAGAAAALTVPELTAEQGEVLLALVAQRLSGTPLAHITGWQQFMGVDMPVGPQALVPRQETELLGRAALQLLADTAGTDLRIIDVCTGAGNLAVAIAMHEPRARVFAADLSGDAVALALRNVKAHHLEHQVTVREGDLLAPFAAEEFHGKVNLLICNPPYISTAKVGTMVAEISAYEPRLAFDGGPFGVKILHRLMTEAPVFLRPGGWLAFEVGLGQGRAMERRLNKRHDYRQVRRVLDHNGNIRVLLAQV